MIKEYEIANEQFNTLDSNTDEIETKQNTTNGHLVDIKANQTNLTQKTMIFDSWGDAIGSTLMDELMISEKNRVAGGVFNGTIPDANFYTTTTNANGTATISNGILTLATTTDSNSSAMVITNSKARYIGGNMNSLRFIGRVGDLGVANNTRMAGLTDDTNLTNAIYFQLNGTTLSIVVKTQGLADIKVDNGSFNGEIATYTLTGNFGTWEILYTNKTIQFYINRTLIHTLMETTLPICGTRNFKAFAKNINTGVGSATQLQLQVMSILTHGKTKTQPKYYFQQGTTTGVLLKTGVGSLHSCVISGVVNNALVTLYDNTSATGIVIWTSGAMSNQTVPFTIPFNDGLQFQNGLFLVISGANCNALVIYE